jgi:hypothetical protein
VVAATAVLLAGLGLVRAAGMGTAPVVPITPSVETGRPFSPDSFWNSPLPDNVAVDGSSAALVAAFDQQWQTFYGSVGLNIDEYGVSVYVAPPGARTFAVSTPAECAHDQSLQRQLTAVPIPDGARPAPGGDHSLVIWQPSTDQAWELWQARRAADGSWSACWGGRIQHVSRSDGVFPYPYGLSASGLSYLAGSIKAWELRAGDIRHAIAVNVVQTAAGVQVPPANRNDGNSVDADAIPEGTRFRLDPSIDVDALGLSPVGVIVARALQRYGMIVTDTAGAVVLMAESTAPYRATGLPSPYAGLFHGQSTYAVLNGIPWDRLQVVSSPPSTLPGS